MPKKRPAEPVPAVVAEPVPWVAYRLPFPCDPIPSDNLFGQLVQNVLGEEGRLVSVLVDTSKATRIWLSQAWETDAGYALRQQTEPMTVEPQDERTKEPYVSLHVFVAWVPKGPLAEVEEQELVWYWDGDGEFDGWDSSDLDIPKPAQVRAEA